MNNKKEGQDEQMLHTNANNLERKASFKDQKRKSGLGTQDIMFRTQ